jgi:hypothetical protein
MSRQLMKICLIALLISLIASFRPCANAASHDHLNLTTKEAVARLRGDWAGDVAAYDAVHQQILHMADGLSMGIINQFPRKFE